MLREGVVAGAVAATGVALLYLVVDLLVVGAPLVTQRLLGAGVATLVGLQATFDTAATTVLQYSALHYAAFIAFGVAAAGVVQLARRRAAAIAGALLLFAVAEASFFVAITLLGDASRTGAVMWPQLAAGNVVGTLLLGGWLWRRHPELRGEVAEGLGGDTA